MIKKPFKKYIQQIENKNNNRKIVKIFGMFGYAFKYELFKTDMVSMHTSYYTDSLFDRYMESTRIDD